MLLLRRIDHTPSSVAALFRDRLGYAEADTPSESLIASWQSKARDKVSELPWLEGYRFAGLAHEEAEMPTVTTDEDADLRAALAASVAEAAETAEAAKKGGGSGRPAA